MLTASADEPTAKPLKASGKSRRMPGSGSGSHVSIITAEDSRVILIMSLSTPRDSHSCTLPNSASFKCFSSTFPPADAASSAPAAALEAASENVSRSWMWKLILFILTNCTERNSTQLQWDSKKLRSLLSWEKKHKAYFGSYRIVLTCCPTQRRKHKKRNK